MRSLIFVAALALCGPAVAGTTIAGDFTRISSVESLVAPYNVVATQTTASYTGLVEVDVAGSGFSLGPAFNDAFAPFGNGFYSLGIGWRDAPLQALRPDLFASRLISFIEGVGPVAPFTLPAPAAGPDFRYRFVIDLGNLASQPLQFGVLDGNYGDNGGEFRISLAQLRAGGAGAVPEPATWAMMIAGFGIAGSMLRRRTASV